MLLEIDDDKTVGGLQEKFCESFPYLKIEFFSRSHGWQGRLLQEDIIGVDVKIGNITKRHQHGTLPITAKQRTSEIKKAFEKIFGLFIQVYYQADGQWIAIKDKDDLALHQLCKIAEQQDLQY